MNDDNDGIPLGRIALLKAGLSPSRYGDDPEWLIPQGRDEHKAEFATAYYHQLLRLIHDGSIIPLRTETHDDEIVIIISTADAIAWSPDPNEARQQIVLRRAEYVQKRLAGEPDPAHIPVWFEANLSPEEHQQNHLQIMDEQRERLRIIENREAELSIRELDLIKTIKALLLLLQCTTTGQYAKRRYTNREFIAEDGSINISMLMTLLEEVVADEAPHGLPGCLPTRADRHLRTAIRLINEHLIVC